MNADHPSAGQTQMGRPVSALVTSREQEQIFPSTVAYTSPGTPTGTPRHNPMMHSASASGPEFFNYPTPQQAQSYGQLQLQRLDPRQRDLMRQEAKMEEIREELRRREDRLQGGPPNPYLGGGTIPRGMSMSTSAMNPPMATHNTNTIRANRFVSQPKLPNGNGGQMLAPGATGTLLRQPGQMNAVRASQPPAPAPKPSRPNQFEPTQQQQQPQQQPPTQVSYRYGPSGYPAQAVSQQQQQQSTKSPPGMSSPSPWEREEKEKVQFNE